MAGIEATNNFGEGVRNARSYTRDNKSAFWSLLRPLLPWLSVSIISTYLLPSLTSNATLSWIFFTFGIVAVIYIFCCFFLGWLRVLMNGADSFVPVNLFHPEKDDIIFMATTFGVFGGAGFLVGAPLYVATVRDLGSTATEAILIYFFAMMALTIWVLLRLSFYFPGKAAGHSITFKQAFMLSRGNIVNFWMMSFFATLRVVMALFGAFIVFSVLSTVLDLTLQENMALTAMLMLEAAFMIVFAGYFAPLIIALTLGVLSSLYKHASENRPV